MKSEIMGELKKVFRPEMINRIDEIVVFHKLTRDEIKEIVDLMIARVRTSMKEMELQLELSEGMKELLVDKGWDPSMGARPLRRAIQRYVEDPVSDKVLAEKIEPGSHDDRRSPARGDQGRTERRPRGRDQDRQAEEAARQEEGAGGCRRRV